MAKAIIHGERGYETHVTYSIAPIVTAVDKDVLHVTRDATIFQRSAKSGRPLESTRYTVQETLLVNFADLPALAETIAEFLAAPTA